MKIGCGAAVGEGFNVFNELEIGTEEICREVGLIVEEAVSVGGWFWVIRLAVILAPIVETA
jgi:hypothetical protein